MQSFQQFMTEALTEAGLADDAVTSALTKIYGNDKLSPKLNKLVATATDDYNSQVGRAKAAEEKVKQYNEWYATANAEFGKKDTEYQRVLAELTTLRNGGAPPDFDASKYMVKDDIVALLKDNNARWGETLKDALSVATQHVAIYKEPLDVEALAKVAGERNIPVRQAYEEWIKPRADAQKKTELVELEKKWKEEGAREALSRHKLPTDPQPTVSAPIFTRMPKDSVPANMNEELLATWHGVK